MKGEPVFLRRIHAYTMRGKGLGYVRGCIYLENGVIIGVGEDACSRGSSSGIVIDGNWRMIVLPGFMDIHMHTPLVLLRGLAQDLPEIEWMHKAISPLARWMNRWHLAAGSRLAVLEALLSGTTLFGDYGSEIGFLLEEVYRPLGLKAAATRSINALAEPMSRLNLRKPYPLDEERGFKGLEDAVRLAEKYSFEKHGVKVLIGPQAVDMVPLNVVKEAYRAAEDLDTLIHMHVAQGGREAMQIKARYGTSTVRLLARHGLLSPRLLAAHCHYASDEELGMMARRGVAMASCQSSIALIDGVVPPLVRYLELGGRAALGTDQAAGNNNQSILAELKIAALLNKTRHRDPTVLPAWRLLRLATREAAEILGLEKHVGSIEEGKRADMVVFDLKAPTLAPVLEKPLRNIAFNLVYAARGHEVKYVFIDGKPVVEEGRPTILDAERVVEEAQKAAEDLVEKGGAEYLAEDSHLVKKWREGLF